MVADFKESVGIIHQTFREIARHEMSLATNLQSLVPSNKESPSRSAQYLQENAVMLKELSQKEEGMESAGIIQEALTRDEQLREKYQMGEKFRFIRDRLLKAKECLGDVSAAAVETKQGQTIKIEEDEMLVYVHLYNAQGMSIRTWQSLITAKALFDFSVNRSIYREKQHIDSFIQAKTNKVQHGYLTIVVKKSCIHSTPESELKDAMGNMLAKIKEGSLRYEKLVSFTHNNQDYVTNEKGELVKKG